MKCAQCGSLIGPLSSNCPDCGSATLPQATATEEMERELQRMQRELDQQLAEASANIQQSLDQLQLGLSFEMASGPTSTSVASESDRRGASNVGANKPYRELLHPIEINAVYQPQ